MIYLIIFVVIVLTVTYVFSRKNCSKQPHWGNKNPIWSRKHFTIVYHEGSQTWELVGNAHNYEQTQYILDFVWPTLYYFKYFSITKGHDYIMDWITYGDFIGHFQAKRYPFSNKQEYQRFMNYAYSKEDCEDVQRLKIIKENLGL